MSVQIRKWTDANGKTRESYQVHVKFKKPDGTDVEVRKKSPIQTTRGAESFERQLRNAILDGTYGQAEKLAVPTVEAFSVTFLTYSANNNKESTVSVKRQTLRDHILPFFGDMKLDAIGPAQIEAFKAVMRAKTSRSRPRKDAPTKWAVKKRYGQVGKPLSAKSINNILGILTKLLNLAEEHGVIDRAPKCRPLKAPKPSFDYLSFDEADRFLAAAEPAWRCLLLTAIKTGLRLGELRALRWSDVDLVQGHINVRQAVWRGKMGTPKGGKPRVVDLVPEMVSALKDQRAATQLKSQFVFCQDDGKILSPGLMKWPLERALRLAGISREEGRIGFHDLRHTFASHCAMRGIPLHYVQEWLGHSSIQMTQRYAHLAPNSRRDAIKALSQVEPSDGSVQRGVGVDA